jgi:hypothetical protein
VLTEVCGGVIDRARERALTLMKGASINYNIALDPQQERKVITLQTLPPGDDDM